MRTIAAFGSAVLIALAVACGNEGQTTRTEATATSGTEAFCAAKASFDALPSDTPDAAALKDYQGKVRPLLDEMDATAPDGLAAPLRTLRAALLEPKTLEEGAAASQDPENAEAREDISVWVHERCAFDRATFVATDNRFTDVPSQVDAGRVSFLLRNEGDAGHAIVLFKVKPDVTADARAIVSGNPEESGEFVNATFAAPGTSSGIVLELAAGRYVFFDDEHAAEMNGEFTVS